MFTGSHHKLKHWTQQDPVNKKRFFHVHRLTLQTGTLDPTRSCAQKKIFFMSTGLHHKLKHLTQQDPVHKKRFFHVHTLTLQTKTLDPTKTCEQKKTFSSSHAHTTN